MLTLADQKKHLLIFSLFAIFFYSYYHISLPPASENLTYTQTQSFNVIPNHVVPNFTLIIKVLTFNRLNSLSRCLHSLAAADYLTDIVHLHIYIDHFATHANQSSDSFLEESRRILQFVDGFEWKFGEKLVHYRTGNVGLQAQWLEAWWPTSDHEFAFVVEDDLQVSPLFYKFLRALILNYYYSSSNSTPSHSVYGASLQRPRFVPGKHGNKIHLDSGTRLFLYQLVGTWGQLLFPRPWKEFRLWYDDHKAKGIKPFLDGMVTTGWYKKMGERIWTPWFIKFIQVRGYFNFYTNFPNERALSVSYRDAGVNYRKSVGPDSQLLDESSLDFNSLKMQPLSTLKWYDFCFREVFPGRVIRSMDELGSVLPSVQKQETILLVSVFRASDALTRNLLCHFERQNIWNYILVGLHSDFLLDLARRGHPVVDADQFLDDTRAYKSIEFQGSNPRLTKEVLVKAYVIKKCLEYGYSSWLLDENFLAVNNDLFLEFIDATSDLYAGKSSQLFSVRSSPSVQKIWTDDFLHEVSVMMDRVSLPIDNKTFPNIVAKLLVQKGDVRIKRVDESSIGMEISSRNANASSGVGKKIVYWSAELGLELVHKRLEELGMWVIDSDSSCKAVICHQS